MSSLLVPSLLLKMDPQSSSAPCPLRPTKSRLTLMARLLLPGALPSTRSALEFKATAVVASSVLFKPPSATVLLSPSSPSKLLLLVLHPSSRNTSSPLAPACEAPSRASSAVLPPSVAQPAAVALLSTAPMCLADAAQEYWPTPSPAAVSWRTAASTSALSRPCLEHAMRKIRQTRSFMSQRIFHKLRALRTMVAMDTTLSSLFLLLRTSTTLILMPSTPTPFTLDAKCNISKNEKLEVYKCLKLYFKAG